MFGYRIGPFAHRYTVLASLLLRYYDIHQMYLLIEHSLPVVVLEEVLTFTTLVLKGMSIHNFIGTP